MGRLLSEAERILLCFEKWIMISVGLLLPAMITVGVFFRYVLKTDLYAIEEIEIFFGVWFYFMGAAYSSYRGSQITADILQVMLKSKRSRKIARVTATCITFLVAIVFTYWCTDLITFAMDTRPVTAVWKIPYIAEYVAVYAGFALMTIYAFRDFHRAMTGETETVLQSGD